MQKNLVKFPDAPLHSRSLPRAWCGGANWPFREIKAKSVCPATHAMQNASKDPSYSQECIGSGQDIRDLFFSSI